VKALRLEGIGRLVVEEVHKPLPDPHDLLVRVEAASARRRRLTLWRGFSAAERAIKQRTRKYAGFLSIPVFSGFRLQIHLPISRF